MTIDRSLFGTALMGIALWTLLCIVGWAFVALGGTVLQAVIAIVLFWLPDAADALQAVVRFLSGLGGGVIALVWVVGAATIAIGTFVLRNSEVSGFYYRETTFRGPGRTGAPDWSPAGRPMKDVTPASPQSELPHQSLPPR